ncbi:AMP-binding protein [Geothrix sp. 21YS21S-4]|uniref:AMP-binding protein n=1 Tax=Geothrix sp. 21YS21S-4 TaxID=3068889 RepID=UPI0027B8E322|nr:AMP-binding protein [Geothrix sp. 21YS21S-4]
MTTGQAWWSNYPAGVGREAQPFPFDNLGQLVRGAAERYGDRKAETLVLPNGMEASLTFKEVDRLSDAFAAYLRDGLRLEAGARVAILLPNALAYPVCAFGALKAGCVVVNTNPLYTPRELELQLADSGAEVLVVLDHFGDKVASVVPRTQVKTVVVTGIADFFPLLSRALIRAKLKLSGQIPRLGMPFTRLSTALHQGALYVAKEHLFHRQPPAPTRDSLALLQYTGGTTGTSKGAMLTHGNLLANLEQIAEITRIYLTHGEETVLTVLPMYHVIAFTINLLFGFHSGSHSILVPNPRPLQNLRPAFRKHEITWMTAVNTLLKALPDEPWFRPEMTRKMLGAFAGGMQTHPAVLERWETFTGCLVIEGFGLSEASPLVTYNAAVREGGRLRRTMAQVGGVGLPLPGTDVRIVDDEGRAVGPGEHGEIVVRGPQVMRGYWNQPGESAQTLRDGWLHTGDVGRLDADGYLEVTDRKKDMIIVSGFNVFPNEVEACIALHPDVADVAVVGVPDEGTGEAVRAFVVLRKELTVDEIRAHCRRLLAGYKVPTSFDFLAEIPKNAVGKALRRELRAPSAAQG